MSQDPMTIHNESVQKLAEDFAKATFLRLGTDEEKVEGILEEVARRSGSQPGTREAFAAELEKVASGNGPTGYAGVSRDALVPAILSDEMEGYFLRSQFERSMSLWAPQIGFGENHQTSAFFEGVLDGAGVIGDLFVDHPVASSVGLIAAGALLLTPARVVFVPIGIGLGAWELNGAADHAVRAATSYEARTQSRETQKAGCALALAVGSLFVGGTAAKGAKTAASAASKAASLEVAAQNAAKRAARTADKLLEMIEACDIDGKNYGKIVEESLRRMDYRKAMTTIREHLEEIQQYGKSWMTKCEDGAEMYHARVLSWLDESQETILNAGVTAEEYWSVYLWHQEGIYSSYLKGFTTFRFPVPGGDESFALRNLMPNPNQPSRWRVDRAKIHEIMEKWEEVFRKMASETKNPHMVKIDANERALFRRRFEALYGEYAPHIPTRLESAVNGIKAFLKNVKEEPIEYVSRAERAERLAELRHPLIRRPPTDMTFDPKGLLKPGVFYNSGETPLQLITPEQLRQLPPGTVLFSINGEEAIVGVDLINLETRFGFIGYGFRLPLP